MPNSRYRALLFDYGGTLTLPAKDVFANFAAAELLDLVHFTELMREWTERPVVDGKYTPIQLLERGQMSIPEFERLFAAEIRTTDGHVVDPKGLVSRFHASVQMDHAMEDLLVRARRHGVHTAVLSNSWNFDYDARDWWELFDTVVVSGTVGMRKPDPEIYTYTAELIGVLPEQCIHVDDNEANVRGAELAGMTGIHHLSADQAGRLIYELMGWPPD
ncbi:phosphoglycolate phosphatase [Sphaerisporangium siamense]|uniref:Epoxide hydrolase-like predicted phosphatase n=1 Tax=Sphaerisporangium siamense TaxID=795645 RepID=A0A7W7G9Y2_9ACTN|nr:HAD family phosphatase [Sphaerisporangium siamense]MBB4701872.1 epoxide hydrolase-like predicted phosphatase [Sphaerisporangium siamense]GII84220.1 phosphoglycolate phosphatase [Sphaerisporangium siamense]